MIQELWPIVGLLGAGAIITGVVLIALARYWSRDD